MKYIWYKLLLMVIWGQWIFSAIILFSGKNGLFCMHNRYLQQKKVADEVCSLEKEIVDLNTTINNWQHDDFNKEKIAREQLQMARSTDEIYYIKDCS